MVRTLAILIGYLSISAIEILHPVSVSTSAEALMSESSTSVISSGSNIRDAGSFPRFLQQPDNMYYIVKTKPANIVCKVTDTARVNFRCNDVWVNPNQMVTSEKFDSVTRQRYIQSSLDVFREEVEGFTSAASAGPSNGQDRGNFWCECCAWKNSSQAVRDSNQQPATCRRTVVVIAYLRKFFEREPISTSVELGSTVELQCLPPPGLPHPEIYWTKNGELIDDEKEINLIVSNDGSLIVQQTRPSDVANYTCVAFNLAGKRFSEVATLTLFVNGQWSSWGQWSECSQSCGRGQQARYRICNNPNPENGGIQCFGEMMQRTICSVPCSVDGQWSSWSSWSVCGDNCVQHRRRQCNSPSPSNGGRYCVGTDLNSVNCSIPGKYPSNCHELIHLNQMQQTSEWGTARAWLFVSLSVAFVIFSIVTVGLLVVWCRRRSRKLAPREMKLHQSCEIIGVPYSYSTRRNHSSPTFCSDSQIVLLDDEGGDLIIKKPLSTQPPTIESLILWNNHQLTDDSTVTCSTTPAFDYSAVHSTSGGSERSRSDTPPNNNFIKPENAFRLPTDIKRRLCGLLDAPGSSGSDWRTLADYLKIDESCLEFFANKSSPTEHLLDLWEVLRCNSDSAVDDLVTSLNCIGRQDAALLLSKHSFLRDS